MVPCCLSLPLESGANFVLDATKLATVHSALYRCGSRESCFAASRAEAARYGRTRGWMYWNRGNDSFARGQWTAVSPVGRAAAIDRSWLELMPSTGAIAVASLGIRPSPAYWDSVFALADALEKTDPDRAELAPLRTRRTYSRREPGPAGSRSLAAPGGDNGGDSGRRRRPAGRPTGGVLALHLDSDDAASRLVSQTLPRLAKLLDRGRELVFWQNGRNVIVSWGEGTSAAAKAAAANPALSVAPHCTAWLQAGKTAPDRLCVFWPARCWPLGPARPPKAQPGPSSRRARPQSGGAGIGKRQPSIRFDGPLSTDVPAGFSNKSSSKSQTLTDGSRSWPSA